MTWRWDQSAGVLTAPDGAVAAHGYSGAELGKNNPAMQDAVGVGPIPRGAWAIDGVIDSLRTGPFTIVLDAEPGTDTCGRSAFRIHGDSIANPGRASHGCIILPRAIREAIWASGDRHLSVVE
jgi:hypothetical protein